MGGEDGWMDGDKAKAKGKLLTIDKPGKGYILLVFVQLSGSLKLFPNKDFF